MSDASAPGRMFKTVRTVATAFSALRNHSDGTCIKLAFINELSRPPLLVSEGDRNLSMLCFDPCCSMLNVGFCEAVWIGLRSEDGGRLVPSQHEILVA